MNLDSAMSHMRKGDNINYRRESWPLKFQPRIYMVAVGKILMLSQTARIDEPFTPSAEDWAADDWVVDAPTIQGLKQ